MSVYYVDDEKAGWRSFYDNGHVESESAIKNDELHGGYYYFHENGRLQYISFYMNGKQHGVSSQWGKNGKLICFSEFNHGSGLDLCCANCGHGKYYLSEERYMKDGQRHGFERWWNYNHKTLWQEGHFHHDLKHGIFREWKDKKLLKEYPKFYVHDNEVDRLDYLRQTEKDSFLPGYHEQDDKPVRPLPQEYLRQKKI